MTDNNTCPNCDDWKETDEEICEGCQKCKTCFGTGVVEYQIAVDDFREMGCEDCGYDPSEDYDDDQGHVYVRTTTWQIPRRR